MAKRSKPEENPAYLSEPLPEIVGPDPVNEKKPSKRESFEVRPDIRLSGLHGSACSSIHIYNMNEPPPRYPEYAEFQFLWMFGNAFDNPHFLISGNYFHRMGQIVVSLETGQKAWIRLLPQLGFRQAMPWTYNEKNCTKVAIFVVDLDTFEERFKAWRKLWEKRYPEPFPHFNSGY